MPTQPQAPGLAATAAAMSAGATAALAGAPLAAEGAGAAHQYLRLAVGNELYAVPIACVREILEVGRMTALPMTPDFVRGVMNLRGAVVPVIDLHARFGRGAAELGRRSCIVIVETDGGPAGASPGKQVLGALVDGVSEVMEIPADAIEPAPPLGTRIPPEFILGMAHNHGQLDVVIDLGRTLAEDDLADLIGAHAA